MKNQYIIVKHVDPAEVERGYAGTLYYNGYVTPCYLMMRNHAQIFTNRRKAQETRKYADRYASGSEIKGWTEVVKIYDRERGSCYEQQEKCRKSDISDTAGRKHDKDPV